MEYKEEKPKRVYKRRTKETTDKQESEHSTLENIDYTQNDTTKIVKINSIKDENKDKDNCKNKIAKVEEKIVISDFLTKTKQSATKTTQKVHKDIKYMKIFEASQTIKDAYWKDLLIEVSKGKFLRKIAIDSQSITCGTKRKQATYVYIDKEPADIAREIKYMFSTYLNTYSKNDIEREKNNIDNTFNEFLTWTYENNWKKMKNKKMKEFLINDYALRMKQEYGFGWKTTRDLASAINSAIYLQKSHTSDDVLMESGKIKEIEDFEINENGFENLRSDIIKDNEQKEQKTKTIFNLWGTFIKSITDENTKQVSKQKKEDQHREANEQEQEQEEDI